MIFFYQNQLDIYNFLLRKKSYETEDYPYLLFYMPEKVLESGEFIFKSELIKMKVDIEHAEFLLNRAVKIINGDMPEPSEKCGYCKLKGYD